MVDVRFLKNNYSVVGGAILSLSNTLQDVVIRGNRLEKAAHDEDENAMFQCPSGYQTTAQGIVATDNEGNVFVASEGSLTITDASFSNNTLGSAIRMRMSEAVIENSTFRGNEGETGPALHLINSNVTLIDSTLQSNSAERGGALYLEENSALVASDCRFESNHATERGGGVFCTSSLFRGSDLIFVNNSAGRQGGALSVASASHLHLLRSEFEENFAAFGGSIGIEIRSTGNVTDCAFSVSGNDAGQSLSGRHIYLRDAELEATDCRLEGGYSSSACGLYARSSVVDIANWTIRNCSALDNGGCINANTGSRFKIRNATLDGCTSSIHAGGIFIQDTIVDIHDIVFLNNSANDNGGGMLLRDSSVVNMTAARFDRCSARNGGAMRVEENATVVATDCTFNRSSAADNGGVVHVTKASNVRLHRCLSDESQAESGGCVDITDNSQIDIHHSEIRQSSAANGGALRSQKSSNVRMDNVTVLTAVASNSGGALQLADNTSATITDSVFLSCSAKDNGGSVHLVRSTVQLIGSSIMNSTVGGDGGGIYCSESSRVSIQMSRLDNNSARNGAAIEMTAGTEGGLTNVTLSDNAAVERGAIARVQDSEIRFLGCAIFNCRAETGGCLHLVNTSATMEDSNFTTGYATGDGGLIVAESLSSLAVTGGAMVGGSAESGGCVALHDSTLTAERVQISNCISLSNGGGVNGKGSTTIICRDCVFENNAAEERGGAISVEAERAGLLAMQFSRGMLRNNSAEYGGNAFGASDSAWTFCVC